MTNEFLTVRDFNFSHQRVLVRCDFNVPLHYGSLVDPTRIEKVIPTLRYLAEQGARTIILSHLGRPNGEIVPDCSLKPVADALALFLAPASVTFVPSLDEKDIQKALDTLAPGSFLLLENLRFEKGEERNSPEFVNFLSGFGDIYINDAFSCAHRAHASTAGLAHVLPAGAGLLMEHELNSLHAVFHSTRHPLMGIVGGAKVSTKLSILDAVINHVDVLAIGGAMANTFLAALGYPVGKSLYEKEMTSIARTIADKAASKNCKIILPVDVVVARALSSGALSQIKDVQDVLPDDMIFDIGPKTCSLIEDALKASQTVLWNGPVGAFEIPPFDKATRAIAKMISTLTKNEGLISVAGGGDTIAALNQSEFFENFTYVSTAGGAFLEWLEGKPLPGVLALKKAWLNARNQRQHGT